MLLTSLTTIAGLTPLMFETSLQAQFLIPMAVTIAFGLAFATFIVLFFVPALLSYHERFEARRAARAARSSQPAVTDPGPPPVPAASPGRFHRAKLS